MAMVATVIIPFQVLEARLDPLELVLVGTVLEATIFLCEVPTGVIADVYSRRLSILIGLVITGAGLVAMGAFARFDTLLLGSLIWGLGYTFISGARQAWISDEIGVAQASRVFLRAAQIELVMRIAAVPIAVAIAAWDLNTPVLIAGALSVLLAAVLAPIMPERGFSRGAATSRSWLSLTGRFSAGKGAVLASPLLMTLFAITFFYGMSSEGFDRLWEAHFLRDLGFPVSPDLEPIVWFGVIRIASALLSIAAAEGAHRRLDLNNLEAVSRWLFLINLTQMLSVLLLALAGGFWVGAIAFLTTVSLSRVYDPLYLAWINRNISSDVRATVLSMSSQADALGQIAGGPVIGLIGKLASIPAALSATALVLAPALLLYPRAFRLGEEREVTSKQ